VCIKFITKRHGVKIYHRSHQLDGAVGIQLENLTFVKEGLEIVIPRSKTDPQGEGQICAIPYGNDKLCAVKALKIWLEEAEIKSGSVFRAINRYGHLNIKALSADSVNVILKNLARKCGLRRI
jgi:hypothetical protein